MKVLMIRSTWGVDRTEWEALFKRSKAMGYDGIEFNLHRAGSPTRYKELKDLLEGLSLKVIVQTFSSWTNYIGPRPRGLSVDDHLEEYQRNLQQAMCFEPLLINIQSGSDCWTTEESIHFYKETLEIDRKLGLLGKVCHETHRNRSFFHPYPALRILKAVPQVQLTGDLSHWTMVCERLMDVSPEDDEVLDQLIPHIRHIHARIGTTQSSQCPDPTDPTYRKERTFFEATWKKVIDSVVTGRRSDFVTVVPEYGAYPYMPLGSPIEFSRLADMEYERLGPMLKDYAAGAIRRASGD